MAESDGLAADGLRDRGVLAFGVAGALGDAGATGLEIVVDLRNLVQRLGQRGDREGEVAEQVVDLAGVGGVAGAVREVP